MALHFSKAAETKRWRSRLSGPEPYAYLLFAGLLVWASLSLVADSSPAERAHFMRLWTLAGSAILTVATPHSLFPSPTFSFYWLSAPTRLEILRDQFRRTTPLFLLVILPIVVAATHGYSITDLRSTILALVILSAIWVLALGRYVRIGRASQEWQEGIRGDWYRSMNEHISTPAPMPSGAMPVILATGGLFLAATIGVLSWAAFRDDVALIPFLVVGLLVAVAIVDLRRLSAIADAEVFHTQAFYSELYRLFGGMRSTEREALTYESLYWVPKRLRPPVWAELVQMDRRMPLGRVLAAGYVGVWALFWTQGYGTTTIAFMAFLAAAKNLAPIIIARRDAAPPAFHLIMEQPVTWAATRSFVSLRWTLPWVLTLGIVAIFADSFSGSHVAAWTLVDVALAVGCAWLMTLSTESRYRRSFA